MDPNSKQTISVDSSDDVLNHGYLNYEMEIDPHFTQYLAWNFIYQICETLFSDNLTDPELPVIPLLAADFGEWNENGTEYTCPLKQNVVFHNGDKFNATAVQKSFNRLQSLLENGGTDVDSLFRPFLYFEIDELLISDVIILDEFTVKFVLNYPYNGFEALLCHPVTSIMAPTQVDATYQGESGKYRQIEATTEILDGTGPYIQTSPISDYVILQRNPTYHRIAPVFSEIRMIRYDNWSILRDATLNGSIDLPWGYSQSLSDLALFNASSHLMVYYPLVSSYPYLLWFEPYFANQTIRKAINYAIDYNFLLHEVWKDSAVRMTSPIPSPLKYYQTDLSVPIYNLTYARQILIEGGCSNGLTEEDNDSAWVAMARSDHPIATLKRLNVVISPSNQRPNMTYIYIQQAVQHLGINLQLLNWTIEEYFDCMSTFMCSYGLYNWYNIGLGRLYTEYNDPSQCILSYIAISSIYSKYLSDPWLNATLIEAMQTLNRTHQALLYKELQEYIITDLYPCAFLFQDLYYFVHSTKITYYPISALGNSYFYPINLPSVYDTETSTGTSSDTNTFVIGGYTNWTIGFFLGILSVVLFLSKRKINQHQI